MSIAPILICTLGTRGDILPFIALGRELKRGGHDVRIMTNENWRAQVTDHGLPFDAIAPPDPPRRGATTTGSSWKIPFRPSKPASTWWPAMSPRGAGRCWFIA